MDADLSGPTPPKRAKRSPPWELLLEQPENPPYSDEYLRQVVLKFKNAKEKSIENSELLTLDVKKYYEQPDPCDFKRLTTFEIIKSLHNPIEELNRLPRIENLKTDMETLSETEFYNEFMKAVQQRNT